MFLINRAINVLAWGITVPAVLLTGLYLYNPRYLELLTGFLQQSIEIGDSKVSIQQIKTIAELAVVSGDYQTIVPIKDTNRLAGFEIGETSLIYIAHARVKVGFDLQDGQVYLEEGGVLQMPAPKILGIELDVKKSKVWDLTKSLWFAPDSQADLLQQAQVESIEQIRKEVCNGEMLEQAVQRVSLLIHGWFLREGLNITVEPKPWSVSECAQVGPQLE